MHASSYPQSHASGCLPPSASSHPLPGNTSTAVTLRRVVLGKTPAWVLNVGLGLMGREGQARRSLERGKKSESPGQPTLQACEYLLSPTQSQALRFREATPTPTPLSGAGLHLPSPRADLVLRYRAAAERLPSPAARQRPALQPGASVPPGRSKGPLRPLSLNNSKRLPESFPWASPVSSTLYPHSTLQGGGLLTNREERVRLRKATQLFREVQIHSQSLL